MANDSGNDFAGNDFYDAIPPFSDFRQVANPEHYRPLPDGWMIGAADIVNSTQAIADGRYKSVSTVGASVISAAMNLDLDVKSPSSLAATARPSLYRATAISPWPTRWPPRCLDIETGSRWSRYLPILAEQFVPIALQFLRTRLRNFDPAHYREVTTLNSDFRKFDDGLKMTIDCSAETVAQLEAIFFEAHSKSIANFGLHRQDNALMTCIVPSPFADNLMHFIDGAAGGYAIAAGVLKKKMAEAVPELPNPAAPIRHGCTCHGHPRFSLSLSWLEKQNSWMVGFRRP